MTTPPDIAALYEALGLWSIEICRPDAELALPHYVLDAIDALEQLVTERDKFADELCTIHDALEACAMDAARYRWLRDHKTVLRPHNRDGPQYMELIFTWSAWPEPASPLSAAIDRARREP